MASIVAISRSLGGIQIDAVLSETHTTELVITDNPIESGALTSDHAYVAPKRYTLNAGISNSPFNQDDSSIVFGSSEARVAAAYEQLVRLQADATPFDVQTGLVLYENMLIESLSVTQDKDTDRVLLFTAALREIEIKDSQNVTLPTARLRSGGVRDRNASTNSRGEVNPINRDIESTDPEAQTLRSWLSSIVNGGSDSRDPGDLEFDDVPTADTP